MIIHSTSASARRNFLLVMAALILTGCAAGKPILTEHLDERTGVTITFLDAPLTLTRDAPDLAVGSRDYAFVGPVEVNRMGKRSYFLWIGMASTVDRGRTREAPLEPIALSMFIRGVPLVIELDHWESDQEQPYYGTAVPVHSTHRAAVSLDVIKLLAGEETLRIGLADETDIWQFSTWNGTPQAWLALAEWPADMPTNPEAYSRRR